ncbi:MAG: OmpH family outer membrane protein [Paracoccaceae bacterium]
MLIIKRLFCFKATLFSFLFIFSTSSLSDTNNIQLENNREYFKRSVLIISHEKIFGDTKLGQAIFEKFKNEEEILSVEAEKIEKIFIDEEKELTSIRPNLDSDEFLKLANDFDKRVELERLNQRQKESIIKENLNIWKKNFFNTYMIPIIQDFMKFYEASIVIDIDSKAFRLVIFDSRINITDSVIERMNNLYINIDEITQEIIS